LKISACMHYRRVPSSGIDQLSNIRGVPTSGNDQLVIL
jgi:hypothetical protein